MIFTISALSFATTSFGVPAGARMPNQVRVEALQAASSSVGTSGSADERFGVATAERAQLAALDVLQHRRDGVERHRHLAAEQVGGERSAALVRHVQQPVPVSAWNCVPIRCCAVPLPLEP